MNESADETNDVDMRKFEAHDYVQNRYENFKGERDLLEEYSGVYDRLNEVESIVDEEDMDTPQDCSRLSFSDYAKDDDMPMLIDQIAEPQRRDERRGQSNGGSMQLDSFGLGSSEFVKDEDMPMAMHQLGELQRREERCEERRDQSRSEVLRARRANRKQQSKQQYRQQCRQQWKTDDMRWIVHRLSAIGMEGRGDVVDETTELAFVKFLSVCQVSTGSKCISPLSSHSLNLD